MTLNGHYTFYCIYTCIFLELTTWIWMKIDLYSLQKHLLHRHYVLWVIQMTSCSKAYWTAFQVYFCCVEGSCDWHWWWRRQHVHHYGGPEQILLLSRCRKLSVSHLCHRLDERYAMLIFLVLCFVISFIMFSLWANISVKWPFRPAQFLLLFLVLYCHLWASKDGWMDGRWVWFELVVIWLC